MRLTEEQLEGLLEGDAPEGFAYEGEQDLGDTRWESHTWHILRNLKTSECWAWTWTAGLTEMQDSRGWDSDVGERVLPYEHKTILYRAKL